MATAADYLKPEVIQQVARLDLKARFMVEGFISGLHASPYHGFSVEFSEHRKYVPGDDLKHIDWGVYGRTDRFYVRKYEAETTVDAHLIIDVSASMAYGQPVSKFDYAIYLAAALSYLMLNQRDRVGLALVARGVEAFIEPRCKRDHLRNILSMLTAAGPSGETDLPASLAEASRLIRHKGIVIVMSDFLCDLDALMGGLARIAFRGHDVILFHILDAAERNFPFRTLGRFRDPETGAEVVADASSARALYLRHLRGFLDALKDKTEQANMDYYLMDTSVSFDQALTSYLLSRSAHHV